MKLDPDQVVINRHKLAELQDTERRLSDLEARLSTEEHRVVELLMPHVGVEAILKTKDGLMALYKLPKGHSIQAPISLPVRSAMPSQRDFEAIPDAATPIPLRIYHWAGFFGRDRRPLYEER